MNGLEFPAGATLTVVRTTGFDAYGDPVGGGYTDSHTIGPCSIIKRQTGRNTDNQERTTDSVKVRCLDPDADIRSTDRVRLPSGRVVDVASTPYAPTNPFTGWRPSLRFTLNEVS